MTWLKLPCCCWDRLEKPASVMCKKNSIGIYREGVFYRHLDLYTGGVPNGPVSAYLPKKTSRTYLFYTKEVVD